MCLGPAQGLAKGSDVHLINVVGVPVPVCSPAIFSVSPAFALYGADDHNSPSPRTTQFSGYLTLVPQTPQPAPELIVPATSTVPADANILLLFSNCPPVRPDLVFSSPSLHLETILHRAVVQSKLLWNPYVSIFLPNFKTPAPL